MAGDRTVPRYSIAWLGSARIFTFFLQGVFALPGGCECDPTVESAAAWKVVLSIGTAVWMQIAVEELHTGTGSGLCFNRDYYMFLPRKLPVRVACSVWSVVQWVIG